LLLIAWRAVWTLRAAQSATPLQLSRNTQAWISGIFKRPFERFERYNVLFLNEKLVAAWL
jgi:hypothetical protein